MLLGVPAAIRPFEPGDLPAILRLWQRAGSGDRSPGDSATTTVVAEEDGRLVGVAVGALTASLGRTYRLAVEPDEARGGDLAQRLLTEIGAALPATGTVVPAALADLGARLVPSGLWDQLRGLDEAKQIIERRVILPLAEPHLAARHSVSPPKAIVLFGPPGTGKTTFAKGIASRLGWPFVEIEAAELGGEGPERTAKLLAHSFERVRTELASAVVFMDEVEDLASTRGEERKVSPSVTNEFLKQIPRLRELPEHLLVCATNSVGRLDHAFLRPGRFDYVLPVGPPDGDARDAIWRRYAGEITDEAVDIGALVAATDLFTPADIEFAARQAAQRAFEREHFEGPGHRATTDEFLTAIRGTRRTLSPEIIDAFTADVGRFARY